jgi:glycosyltransferase involved in cell wall biosynthesis
VSASVAFDVRRAQWAPQVGIARYARCLVRAILALEPKDIDLWTLELDDAPKVGDEANRTIVGRGHHFLQRLYQEQVAMARIGRRVDLVHLPWYEGPLRPASRFVVNVHDLDTLERPAGYSWRFRAYYNALLRTYVRTAKRIIVPSEATLSALRARWPSDRYVVIPYGVDPVFEDWDEHEDQQEGVRYILYTGGFGMRKHLGDLLKAFDRIASSETDVRLVISGTPPHEVRRAVSDLRACNRVDLVGHVTDHELARLYRSASAVAYPSVLEGFGFPIVEGFSSGTPVVAARAGSIPEIAGDACVLVEPGSPTELAEGLLAVLNDGAFAARLIAAGRERARRYRWSESARRTLDVYRAALSQ